MAVWKISFYRWYCILNFIQARVRLEPLTLYELIHAFFITQTRDLPLRWWLDFYSRTYIRTFPNVNCEGRCKARSLNYSNFPQNLRIQKTVNYEWCTPAFKRYWYIFMSVWQFFIVTLTRYRLGCCRYFLRCLLT